MRSVDVVDELLGEDRCSVGNSGGNKMGEFGEAANDDENSIEWLGIQVGCVGGWGKFGDVVPGY